MATQTDIQCIFHLLHEPVNKKEEYSTLEILNVLYAAGYFCVSVLGERMYVFHISEEKFRCNIFVTFHDLLFGITSYQGRQIIYFCSSVVTLICYDLLLNLLHYFLMVFNARI